MDSLEPTSLEAHQRLILLTRAIGAQCFCINDPLTVQMSVAIITALLTPGLTCLSPQLLCFLSHNGIFLPPYLGLLCISHTSQLVPGL
jgi:hypothetical protein